MSSDGIPYKLDRFNIGSLLVQLNRAKNGVVVE